MIWIDMLATFIVATLSGMGIGSGGLMVLYLTFVRNAPQLAAQGFNLLFFLFASASSMIVHLLRRKIFWLAVLIMILAGLPAAYLGTRCALWLPDGWMTRLFGLFLVIVGTVGVFGKKRAEKSQKT
jgi:uncharacterized membrane protein YfcA